ncbi:MAG: bifunctional methylenetetrahydrofolate dehydrogenase/methenyltetrahydrofolate cyclohydrolase FolD [Legionella sp.]
MTPLILEGISLASSIKTTIKKQVELFSIEHQRAPGLAVILIGNDHASCVYVNHKRRACEEVGLVSFAYDLPSNTSEQELIGLISDLNHNSSVDGVLVQLPLPEQINTATIIEHIDPAKDVDGFHPYNLGRLAQGKPTLRPCTPYGVIQLLLYHKISLVGKHVVVVGASNIVGKPMGLELLLAKATVTICHHQTKNLKNHVSNADIVIVATGNKDVVTCDWLNKNQIVVDIGIHRCDDGSLRGDLDFNQAINKVAAITPVPGGVGPMTISTLLQNTILAAQHRLIFNHST